MSSLSLSGLASGFDWQSVVDQLIEIERVPQTKLINEQSTNESKLSALSSLRTRLEALQTATEALSSSDLFASRTVALSDDSLDWEATAASSATNGTYTINVTQLATQTSRTGTTGIATSISDEDIEAGSENDAVLLDLRLATTIEDGTFTVNGHQVGIETTDTLAEVFEKIATATDGAVTGRYDAESDRVSLTSTDGSEIVLGSGSDTSNLLYALKLHNTTGASTIASASALGVLAVRDSLADSGLAASLGADENGDGSLTINGVTIEYNVDDDSLVTLMNRINDSDAGVTMSYDAQGGRFSLVNTTAGNLGLWAEDSSGGVLSAMGLGSSSTIAFGTNAEFSINNGGTLVTASNTLTSAMHGIKGLTVDVTSLGSQTITIAADTDAIETGIETFISKYNAVQSYIDTLTAINVDSDGTVSTGLMATNSEFSAIARQLRSQVFASVSGLSGSIQRLASLGIDFNNTSSQLSIEDSSALSDALSSNLDDVETLFTSTDGLSKRIGNYLDRITTTGGLIDAQESSLESQNDALDKQIDDLERRLEAERERLVASFVAMEEAQSNIQTQQSALENMLSSLS